MHPRHSFHVIREAFRATPWQTFAVIAAIVALVMGLALLLYPDVYALSRSYLVLARWWPDADSLGFCTVAAAALVLLTLHRSAARFGLIGVLLFHVLIAVTSFLAVRLSGGTILYVLFAGLAFYGYVKSGVIGRGR